MKFFKEKIMPSLVLCLICSLVCLLLVGAYELTYVDNTGVMTDELKAGCKEVFGSDDFEILKDADGNVVEFEGVTAAIVNKETKQCLFEIYEDGYSKDGIHVLVGMDENGAVAGVTFITCGETPGLGTKVNDKNYLAKFIGADNEAAVNSVDKVTGASYSSKGIKAAITTAVNTYSENREAIFGE